MYCGGYYYTPIPRHVVAFAVTPGGGGVNDPTDDGGVGGDSSVGTTGTVGGVESEREDHPCGGGALISTVVHGRIHEYIPIAGVVLTFAFTTRGFTPCADTATNAMTAVVGGIAHITARVNRRVRRTAAMVVVA